MVYLGGYGIQHPFRPYNSLQPRSLHNLKDKANLPSHSLLWQNHSRAWGNKQGGFNPLISQNDSALTISKTLPWQQQQLLIPRMTLR